MNNQSDIFRLSRPVVARRAILLTALALGAALLLLEATAPATRAAGVVASADLSSANEPLMDLAVQETVPPDSVATSPPYANGDTITVTYTASVTGTANLAEVRLHFNYGNGYWITTTYTSTAKSGAFYFEPHNWGGTNFLDGTYHFQTVARDDAGNVEPGPSGSGDTSTLLDTEPPTATVNSPPRSCSPSWQVQWSGYDPEPGSGIDSYKVQYDVDDSGSWETWYRGTNITSTFGPTLPVQVEYDHIYSFRVRAYDHAGNQGDYSPVATTRVEKCLVFLPLVVQNYLPLTNGGLEEGWTGWAHGGELPQEIVEDDKHSGDFSARLGNPSFSCAGGAAVGSAWMEQSFAIPSSGVSKLQVYYRIFSQDSLNGDKYDRFEIWINDSMVLRDGNESGTWGCANPVQSQGWELFEVDVTSYAGGLITLRLENLSWPDGWFNTWTYVDDVQLLP